MKTYVPRPIDTSDVVLPRDLIDLTEDLARNAHDNWARLRIEQGWRYGPERNDAKKEHPDLVPYEDLPEEEKDHDRTTAVQTLKAVLASGFRIERAGGPKSEDGESEADPAAGA